MGLPEQITELVARGHAVSRSDLARALGVSPSTVTVHVQAMLADGTLEEAGSGVSQGGRRPRVLKLAGGDAGVVLAADLGGTHARVGAVGLTGELLTATNLLLQITDGPEDTLARVAAALQRVAPEGREVKAVSVALPGPVNFEAGRVELPSRMPGWSGFPVRDWLADHMGVPAVVENDANVMALGEHHARMGASGHSITVKIGTAIGSGIIVDGRLHRGATWAAGDITHTRIEEAGDTPCTCGNLGCLETVASGAGLARLLREKGYLTHTTADVLRLTREADPIATSLVRRAGGYLGRALSMVVNFFNPHAVFLTGGASSSEPFVAAVRSTIYESCHPLVTQSLTITPAETAENAGLLGAGRLALETSVFTRS
ncbi:ROK family transcriptional regulator [Tessaracoccus sp. ZS01]|uniref:ROK family transcriptional regulator n=1 Tax=Tessaracoccus sp. ZS01 TaxID=1906324 RepID=UPI00096D6AA3|nr:ROK family transcriptional regulator [Tessaracoccus sp. ZS01]MCG6568621.1 ROK family transcriptional regulator [Tessaracoccus sp. ZS01]OMG52221.1 ROK family transcriptional regulator [Tessaracoccus sp. ZS01]